LRYRGRGSALLERMLAPSEPSQPSLEREGPAYYEVGPKCQVENMGGLLEKYLGARSSGFFVEVGAYDGLLHSNTVGLARRGWHGVLVEPHPISAKKCRENYQLFPNITIEEYAITSRGGEVQKLRDAGTLSSTSTVVQGLYEKLEWSKRALSNSFFEVETKTLDDILESYSPKKLDLLAVDVEGAEEAVFAGFSINHWRPTVLIVELTENHSDFREFRSGDSQLYQMILNFEYVVAFKDSINTVFVDSKTYKSKNL